MVDRKPSLLQKLYIASKDFERREVSSNEKRRRDYGPASEGFQKKLQPKLPDDIRDYPWLQLHKKSMMVPITASAQIYSGAFEASHGK
jgi:hypothetical protein